MQRTDQELAAIGAFAAELASNGAFNEVFKEYTDAMLQRIVNSEPHETKLREFEYAQLRAMGGFTVHLVGLAEAAQAIINKHDKQVDPELSGVDLED